MAPHSSTLAWKIPWTEEPGGLQSMGSLRVGHDWATSLSLFTFHSHVLEKEMATHSSVLAWRIPGTGEPGGLPSMGSHRVRHDWSDLAAAASAIFLLDKKKLLAHPTTLSKLERHDDQMTKLIISQIKKGKQGEEKKCSFPPINTHVFCGHSNKLQTESWVFKETSI